MKRFNSLVLIALTLTLVACGGGGGSPTPTNTPNEPEDPALPDGRLVYMEPVSNGNTFACAYCHALNEPSSDGFVRPGHAIGDALRRPHFKNSQLPNFIDAVNVCLDVWMAVPTPWTEDTPEFQALELFLDNQDDGEGESPSLETGKATPIIFADNAAVSGDAATGLDLFNNSCALCHGQNAEGTERAPSLRGRLEYEGSANYIAEKVRLSGPIDHDIYLGDSVGGRMPFWAADRLSNENLEHIIAFLINTSFDMGATPTPTPPPVSSCASTHPKIGQTATFTTRSHNVSGTATIIDDCTIRLDDFNFDGGGIDVRVYSGIGATFANGFSMGENLVNNTGYTNDSLTVTLPSGMTMDDVDYISIWCVPVAVSFGDGFFQ